MTWAPLIRIRHGVSFFGTQNGFWLSSSFPFGFPHTFDEKTHPCQLRIRTISRAPDEHARADESEVDTFVWFGRSIL